jgi:hypothetical protein
LEESGALEPVSVALDAAVFAGAARGGLSSVVFVSTGAAAAAASVNARPVAAVAAVVTLCVAPCGTGAAAASLAAA